MGEKLSDARRDAVALPGDGLSPRARASRIALALCVVACLGAGTAATAHALTLRLVFPDGQPMTYGSACVGHGCLSRGDGVDTTDDLGQVYLPDSPRLVEYRRDGVSLNDAPADSAAGRVAAVGDRATVVLPRLLFGSQPAVDAAESDLVARLNEARAAQGLPRMRLNAKLSRAADLQATWLTISGVTLLQPDLFHIGPYQSDMGFRHGEVSLPEPGVGAEVAEAGGTAEEAISDWLASPAHRSIVLEPGELLAGVARVGPFIIVQTHKPCNGCDLGGTEPGVGTQPPPLGAVPVAPPPTASAAATPTPGLPACGREQLTTRRLKGRRPRVRLRVGVHCLRPGARYVLLVRQGTSGRILKTVPIARAGTTTLRLRPARSARRLRVRLKRDGRAIAGRTVSLR